MYVQKFFELFGHGAYDEYNRRLRDFLARTVCGELGQVLCEDDLFVIGGVDKISLNTVSQSCDASEQTPSTVGLRHPSFNHCRIS